MFKFIFYFIGVIFIIYEIIWIFSPKRKILESLKFYELRKQNEGKKWEDVDYEYQEAVFNRLPLFIFMIWFICGLFTFNWVAFLGIMILQFVIITPISIAIRGDNIGYLLLHWFNSVIGLVWAIFVILNTYHLKIDLFEIIKGLI